MADEGTAAKKRKLDDAEQKVEAKDKKGEKEKWEYPTTGKQWLDIAKQSGKQEKLSVLRAGRLIYFADGYIYCTVCEKTGKTEGRYKFDIKDNNAVRFCTVIRLTLAVQSIGNMTGHFSKYHLQDMIDKAFELGKAEMKIGTAESLGRSFALLRSL